MLSARRVAVPLNECSRVGRNKMASAVEWAEVDDEASPIAERVQALLLILRRATPEGVTADEMAFRALDCLSGLRIPARLVYGSLDELGTYPFIEVEDAVFDPTLAALLLLDGRPASAARIQRVLVSRKPGHLALRQSKTIDKRFSAQRPILFTPLYLMQLREGLVEDRSVLVEPPRSRIAYEGNTLRVAFAMDPELIVLEVLSNAGLDAFEARAAAARLVPYEGPSGVAARLGLRTAATLDMESSGSNPLIAAGVRLEPDAVARSLRISDGIESWRAQRMELDKGGVAVVMPTIRDKRYVLTGYARVLAGHPEVVVRGLDPRVVWSSPLAPEVGWTAFMSPPFPATGPDMSLTFEHYASWSADLDGLALLELPTPVCVTRGFITCGLQLPL
jgi:hypothetical protein